MGSSLTHVTENNSLIKLTSIHTIALPLAFLYGIEVVLIASTASVRESLAALSPLVVEIPGNGGPAGPSFCREAADVRALHHGGAGGTHTLDLPQ